VRCSIDHAKRSFYRTANAVFAKIGRFASDDVIIELMIKKCVQIQYGLEVCPLPRRILQSLDFTVNPVLIKLFKSSNIALSNSAYISVTLKVQLRRRFQRLLVNAVNDNAHVEGVERLVQYLTF